MLDIPYMRFLTVPGIETMTASFTTDIPALSAWGKPVLLGPGSILVAHTDREFLAKAELMRAIDLYVEIGRLTAGVARLRFGISPCLPTSAKGRQICATRDLLWSIKKSFWLRVTLFGMSTHAPNSLAHASSAYLRSAMNQPTAWHEWGAEAFALAQAQDKPILLDVGAVWCHWCHVMDRESYESAETAAILNQHFICIKVDRDERPDVDARYQAAVASITGQGGWPLTVFLTPDGKMFFGGTYFPPVDSYGRASFGRVLLAIAEAFRERRDGVGDRERGADAPAGALGGNAGAARRVLRGDRGQDGAVGAG